MYIKQDMDFNDLMNNCWSGAVDTLKTIEEHDKEEELMAHLESDVFASHCENTPTLTEVNDYLWFEWETIFESLGISETEEEEEEIDYEKGVTEQETEDFESFCRMHECEKCPYNDCCVDIKECKERYTKLKGDNEEEEEPDENGGYIIPLF